MDQRTAGCVWRVSFAGLLFLSGALYAQDDHDHAGQEPHRHEHPVNEFGVANSAVRFSNEDGVSYGLHMHYLRRIARSDYRLGLGYERIFDEHKHSTVGLVVGYQIMHGLTFLLSPGLTFEDNDLSVLLATLHAEVTYEFDLGPLHIGPLLEWAVDPEDVHISLGLHLGFGFGKR